MSINFEPLDYQFLDETTVESMKRLGYSETQILFVDDRLRLESERERRSGNRFDPSQIHSIVKGIPNIAESPGLGRLQETFQFITKVVRRETGS